MGQELLRHTKEAERINFNLGNGESETSDYFLNCLELVRPQLFQALSRISTCVYLYWYATWWSYQLLWEPRHPPLCSSALSHAWEGLSSICFLYWWASSSPGPWTSRRNSWCHHLHYSHSEDGVLGRLKPVHSYIEKYHLASLAGFINEDRQTNTPKSLISLYIKLCPHLEIIAGNPHVSQNWHQTHFPGKFLDVLMNQGSKRQNLI